MSCEIVTIKSFDRDFKRLSKRYRSLASDYDAFVDSLELNPRQGVEIAPNIRKIRMPVTSKVGGKSGGARVISFDAFVTEVGGRLVLAAIYDKSQYSTVDPQRILDLLRYEGVL